jgi:hypothetical protein
VHDQASQAVALDGNARESLVLDEVPEEIVAYFEQNVLAVRGFTQGEHPRPGREHLQDGGGIVQSSSHTLEL